MFNRKVIELDHQKFSENNLLPVSKFRLLVIKDDDVLRSYLVRRLEWDDYIVHEANDVESGKRMPLSTSLIWFY